MNYNITIKKGAAKALSNLRNEDYEKVRDAIKGLSEDPRPLGCLKLTAREGWRIRIGVYRVIYEINERDKKVIVLAVGHRRDIYR